MTAPSLSTLRTVPPSDGEPGGLRISSEWVLREVARSVAAAGPAVDRYGRVASILKRATLAWDVRVCRVDGPLLRQVATGRGLLDAAVDLADTPLLGLRPPFAPVWTPVSPAAREATIRALVGGEVTSVQHVPCVADGELVGVLEVLGTGAGPWNGALLAQLGAAADIVAVALRGDRERVERLRAETLRLQEERARDGERRRLEDQLVHAARLAGVGEATVSIVHDLAQPLMVLDNYLELLERDFGDDEVRQRAVPTMCRATQRIAGLVRHLRDYARAEPNPHQPVDLLELAVLARELCAGDRAAVTVTGTPGVVVRADAARLEQVVVNLVTNALASGGAPVTVTVRRAEDELHAVLDVSDHGPGVPPELRSLVFEPFFTTRPRGQGTGLGLAICARIVREHGGTIEVDDAPGGGARFRVVLPAE